MSAISKEWLEKELTNRGKTKLGNNFGLSAGNFNALIKVMETKDEPNDPDGFDRLITQALRQSISQFARIEKLEDDIKQANNIIRYNDGEVARLSACQIDADRYRWLRSCHEAQIGERHATVVMWADEPWEPEDGDVLDQAIDLIRTNEASQND